MFQIQPHSKIFIAGHRGLVGSACVRIFKQEGFSNLILKSRQELDLLNESAVREFFATEKPEVVILAAAKVGGIAANSKNKVAFLVENLRLQNNVILAAADFDTKKLVFLGSSCIYPKEAKIPISEDQLLTGALEPTNDAYALAKISGLKLCQYLYEERQKRFISLMPTNMYGPNDNYDLENSHVIPALISKFWTAKKSGAAEATVWGSGRPLREFLHADDLAKAILFCVKNYEGKEFLNVGSSEEVSIGELARIIARIVGFEGRIIFDISRPDGTMRKMIDSSKLKSLGWEPSITLEQGLRSLLPEVEKKLGL